MTKPRRLSLCLLLVLSTVILPAASARAPAQQSPAARLFGQVFAAGRQLDYLHLWSDEIGSRLTGSAGARRAEEATEAEMRRLGLEERPARALPDAPVLGARDDLGRARLARQRPTPGRLFRGARRATRRGRGKSNRGRVQAGARDSIRAAAQRRRRAEAGGAARRG